MEMHATTVSWDGDGKITVYDKTQGPQNVQAYLAAVFGFSAKKVRVMNTLCWRRIWLGPAPPIQRLSRDARCQNA